MIIIIIVIIIIIIMTTSISYSKQRLTNDYKTRLEND